MRDINNRKIPTVSRHHNVMLSKVRPPLSFFFVLGVNGRNSFMPNIHHARLCYECGGRGYDDEYGGSGAEE
jgi:hypothetical protein